MSDGLGQGDWGPVGLPEGLTLSRLNAEDSTEQIDSCSHLADRRDRHVDGAEALRGRLEIREMKSRRSLWRCF